MHHQNLEQLKTLRLFGMARALEELAHTRERDALTFDDQLALLIEREAADRANLALTHRLRRAHLRQNACLENLDLRTPRGLDRALVRDLASCRWVSEHRPILVIGPTGVGKTWIVCALVKRHPDLRDTATPTFTKAWSQADLSARTASVCARSDQP